MVTGNITIKIIDSIDVIERRSNKAIADHMNSIVTRKKGYMHDEIIKMVKNWILEQPEIISLKQNELAAQLGLPAGSANSVVDSIISSIQYATDVLVEKFNRKLQGGVTLRFQPEHFANLMALSGGHVVLPDDGDLHWLRWLLESGHKIIVVDYHFISSPGHGRSGGGVMTAGGAWRVPPEFAGTLDDNFVTRAFSGRYTEIEELFGRVLSR